MPQLTSEDPMVREALANWDHSDIDQAHKALDAIMEQLDRHVDKTMVAETLESILALAYAGLSKAQA